MQFGPIFLLPARIAVCRRSDHIFSRMPVPLGISSRRSRLSSFQVHLLWRAHSVGHFWPVICPAMALYKQIE